MVRLFDGPFLGGTVLAALAVVLALVAASGRELPWLGAGVGALVAVAIVGMASCMVGGVGQAPAVGWTHPVTIVGIVLGIATLVVIAAGLFGWSAILQPVSGLIPGSAAAGVSETVRTALVALAGLLVVKWLVAVGLATYRSLTG